MSDLEKLYISPLELSSRWSVGTVTLAQWRSRGQGPEYAKMNRLVRYPIASIEAWENAERRTQNAA